MKLRNAHLLAAVTAAALAAWLLAGCGGSPVSPGVTSQSTPGITASTPPTTGAATPAAPGGHTTRVLIGCKSAQAEGVRAAAAGLGVTVTRHFTLIPATAGQATDAAIAALRANPNVEYVEEDAKVKALGEQLVWGAAKIGAELVWGATVGATTLAPGHLTGSGVKVAVIDTGMDYTHPDLKDNYAGGYNFVAATGNPMDDNGHGTHVSGIIAAEANGVGVVQTAPKARLYALKVLDSSGSGYISDIVSALQWCVTNKMQIASMSFGGGDSYSMHRACDAAYAANVLLVAAAGNDGASRWRSAVNSPGSYSSVIAVAATDQNNTRASWSSTGPEVELSAPGVNILSDWPGGKYETLSGTSMATPYVSGTAALVIQGGVTSASVVRQRLDNSATHLGSAGRNSSYGYGLVNAPAATNGLTASTKH